MKGRVFPGFPAGRLRYAAVPDVLFSELLPAIDDLGELKLTLHVLWRLQRQTREPRHLALSELRADALLLAGLDPTGACRGEVASPSSPSQGEDTSPLQMALQRAVERGVLLRLVDAGGGDEAWYFMNSEQGREAYARAQRGEVSLGGTSEAATPQPVVERPNIFQLYERSIGLLQPLIADELRDAEGTYPPEWIEEAFRIAVERNARNWHYVRGILERWAREGKGDGKAPEPGDRARYIKGKYGDRIQH
jgi:DNA replication protein